MEYTAAVITVSDKGSRGEREDTSGPALVEILKGEGYNVQYTSIVPDEKDQIKAELLKCADELKIALILTTGGTGFSPRDITPEASLEVIERLTPGIPEAMRAESMKITPHGCLSREVAGIRGGSLIINLPGSKKASTENFQAVVKPVAHGLKMLYSEGSAECAPQMETSAEHNMNADQSASAGSGVGDIPAGAEVKVTESQTASRTITETEYKDPVTQKEHFVFRISE